MKKMTIILISLLILIFPSKIFAKEDMHIETHAIEEMYDL